MVILFLTIHKSINGLTRDMLHGRERGRGRKRTILCFSDDFHSTARFMVFTFHGPVLGPTTIVIANAQSLLLSESSDQNYSLSRASSARSGSCNC